MATIVHFDQPAEGFLTAPASALRGWVATDEPAGIGELALVNDSGTVVDLRRIERPDVADALPHLRTAGFEGWIDLPTADRAPWRLRLGRDGNRETPVPLRADRSVLSRFFDAKSRKLSSIRELLRCPQCRSVLDTRDATTLRCANGHAFASSELSYDFLTPEVRERVGAVPTSNVSAHGYDPLLLSLIAGADGPILDAGAGLRPEYRDDVVNLEIVPYPTTDVVAAGEYLPFADESFGLVISVAVLEHVRDPFTAARELTRVLRPGGRIFAAVPFLQPYHGYPDHYYNMTEAGLRNLFRTLEIERVEVTDAGLPIFALTWMLQVWRNALPPEVARDFAGMTVGELCADPMTLIERPFVRALPAAVNTQLGALNVLIGRKPGTSG